LEPISHPSHLDFLTQGIIEKLKTNFPLLKYKYLKLQILKKKDRNLTSTIESPSMI